MPTASSDTHPLDLTVEAPPSRSSKWVLFSRLKAPVIPGGPLRIERVIAVARLFLTAIALVAIDFEPIQPASHGAIARTLLIAFAAHSIAALVVLRARQHTSTGFAVIVHAIDLVGAAVITLPMAGSTSSFFAFFLFVVASAAFRWGVWETLATTVAAMVLVFAETRVTLDIPAIGLTLTGHHNLDRVVVRAAYLAMMGMMLGYLAEESRQLRAETGAVVELLGKIRVDAGLTRALGVVAREVQSLFKASHLLLVLEDVSTHHVYRFDTSSGWPANRDPEGARLSGIDPRVYLFGHADQGAAIVRRPWSSGARSTYQIRALDPAGRIVEAGHWTVPDGFAVSHPFSRLITVSVRFGEDWRGRLFVFEPGLNVDSATLAHFLQTLVQQVGPAVFNVHLQDKLRTHAGAIERARVARELHDGVIQSLIAVEMQLQVLRGQADVRTTPTADDLGRLQSVIRDEVLNLRDLLQQMRPPELDPDELLDYLASTVDRFGRDTGIRARFTSDLKHVTLPRQACFELVRIVQEGLVNVRKHSAATNVLVRFGVHEGSWRLEIEDDGRGFPFEGRLSHRDLDARLAGPTVIKERVRAIGGQLAIDSRPGRGTRLEVLMPQDAHAA